jgi:competence protein ComEC
MAVLFMLFLLHLAWEYRSYREFVSQPFYFTHATVLSAYTKHRNQRRYQVLKLQSDEGRTFYTTTHQKRDLSGHRLRLQLFPDSSISFWDYLGTFYVKSRIKQKKKLRVDLKQKLKSYVAQQHKDPKLAAFYNAIFFATPLPRELRQKISMLGVSHLVALSGFHLTILWGIVYGILMLLYKPLQQRYFPYRFALRDVGLVSVVILGIYVWFVGAPPSLVRAYVMVLMGWSMLLMGIELLSFTFLAVVVALLVVLFPSLLVSLGFWFSVAGVYFIFLLLHYTRDWHPLSVGWGVIPVGIFLLMLPLVHVFFPVTTPYQLLSPLLSLIFIPFYPLVMVLHLIGQGGWFDPMLTWLFALPQKSTEQVLPLWVFIAYMVVALGAMRYRILLYVALGSALVYAGVLFG